MDAVSAPSAETLGSASIIATKLRSSRPLARRGRTRARPPLPPAPAAGGAGTSRRPSPAFLQRSGHSAAHQSQRRREPEQQRAEECCRHRVEQHLPVHRDHPQSRHVGRTEPRQRRDGDVRQSDADGPADGSQHDTLDQQLTRETPARGAESSPHAISRDDSNARPSSRPATFTHASSNTAEAAPEQRTASTRPSRRFRLSAGRRSASTGCSATDSASRRSSLFSASPLPWPPDLRRAGRVRRR